MDEKNHRLVVLFAVLCALVATPSAADETFGGSLVHVAALNPSAIPSVGPLEPLSAVQEIKDAGATVSTIDLTAQPDDLWDRIRKGFAMPDLDSPLVAKHQAYYLNHPQYLARITERSRRYLHHIVEEIEKRGMPMELALLPMVESAFDPMAYSRARASGLWQFVPSTARTYQLKQDWWVDQRRDIVASTSAALDYLQIIYQMHGDWHLALASYNWGEGAVGRAIEKNRAKGLPTDYLNLPMPAETRNYVPKLLALKNIIAQAQVLGVSLAPIPNEPYFATVKKPGDMDIAVAAELAETPVKEFIALNPGYNRPVITGQAKLVLPADKVETFLTNLEDHDKPLVSWTEYTLKRGERFDQVAARFGLSGAKLRQINGLSSRAKIVAGRTLLVPKGGAPVGDQSLLAVLPTPHQEAEESPPAGRTRKTVLRSKGGKTVKVAGKGSRAKTAKVRGRSTKVSASSKVRRGVAKSKAPTKSDIKTLANKNGDSSS